MWIVILFALKIHYENDPKTSIRSTAKDLELSYQSMRRILKDDEELTYQHRDGRKQFCRWFMEEDIDPHSTIDNFF